MLNVVVCDDERIYRNDLKKIIETELDLCGIDHRIHEFSCGEELIDSLKNHDYQIIFLDIEMAGLNGMDAARELRCRNSAAVIIFVTSYPDFVFQGYEVKALNYLLKPYQKEKLLSILHTALDEQGVSQEQYYLIEQRSKSIRLPLHEVKYFFSDKRSVTAVTADDSYVFYGKLSEVELELPDFFIRIHNRYLLNLNFLQGIEGNQARLEDQLLPVSRACKQNLSIAFAKYMLN